MLLIPCLLVFHQGIQDRKELSHAGSDCQLLWFFSLPQTQLIHVAATVFVFDYSCRHGRIRGSGRSCSRGSVFTGAYPVSFLFLSQSGGSGLVKSSAFVDGVYCGGDQYAGLVVRAVAILFQTLFCQLPARCVQSGCASGPTHWRAFSRMAPSNLFLMIVNGVGRSR